MLSLPRQQRFAKVAYARTKTASSSSCQSPFNLSTLAPNGCEVYLARYRRADDASRARRNRLQLSGIAVVLRLVTIERPPRVDLGQRARSALCVVYVKYATGKIDAVAC